jgi:hypothetical protein
MTISSRKRGGDRSTLPREDLTSLATESEAQTDLSVPDEQMLTEETRRRAVRYATKLAAALRPDKDPR